ncbi:serine hydrolase [Enterococcus timonensis]|uniref:serine hydrolase n=1 Tax=Enterococcus timonensis TaxID=1852364 RepID=UPI0008D94DFC|nr:serine hydrolase [Enterococcus timonensis]
MALLGNIFRLFLLIILVIDIYGLFFFKGGFKRWGKKHYRILLWTGFLAVFLAGSFWLWPLIGVMEVSAPSIENSSKKDTATLNSSAVTDFSGILTESSGDGTNENNQKQSDTIVTQQTAENKTLTAAWENVIQDSDAFIDIAVYQPETNLYFHYTNAAQNQFYTASIVKVAVITEFMRQVEAGTLTMTADDETMLSEMIEESDNDATTYLVEERIGGLSALDSLFQELSMTNSYADTDAWGITTTSSIDQLKLLNKIFYDPDFLNTDSQTAIISRMENIDVDQNWGISVEAPYFALKDGWLDLTPDCWIINSIGQVASDANSFTIAILTDQNATFSEGVDLVEELAKTTEKILLK